MYNFTNITAANSTLEMLRAANADIFDGWFTILLLVALFIIIFVNTSFYGSKESMLATSFIVGLLSWFMWFAELFPISVPIIMAL